MSNKVPLGQEGAPQAETLQSALLEMSLTATRRTRQIYPEHLPQLIMFDGPALDEGRAAAADAARYFEETGKLGEPQFVIGINPATHEFELASAPTPLAESTITQYGIDTVINPGPISATGRVLLFVRMAQMMEETGSAYAPAYTSAINAHAHPPVERLDGYGGLAHYPGLYDAHNASPPSSSDALSVTITKQPTVVFGQGLTVLMVPTDKTPSMTVAEVRTLADRLDGLQVRVTTVLKYDYDEAARGGQISPILEMVLRTMNPDAAAQTLSARELFERNALYLHANTANGILRNPVVLNQIAHVGKLLAGISAVGYYNLTGSGNNVFIRFTA